MKTKKTTEFVGGVTTVERNRKQYGIRDLTYKTGVKNRYR